MMKNGTFFRKFLKRKMCPQLSPTMKLIYYIRNHKILRKFHRKRRLRTQFSIYIKAKTKTKNKNKRAKITRGNIIPIDSYLIIIKIMRF